MDAINPALINAKNQEILRVILEAQDIDDPKARRRLLKKTGYSEQDIKDFFTMLERRTHELAGS